MTAAERTRQWKAEQQAMRTRSGQLCAYGCGEETYTDWTAACASCNTSKRATPMLLWLAGRPS